MQIKVQTLKMVLVLGSARTVLTKCFKRNCCCCCCLDNNSEMYYNSNGVCVFRMLLNREEMLTVNIPVFGLRL